jgi:hypothetical protein
LILLPDKLPFDLKDEESNPTLIMLLMHLFISLQTTKKKSFLKPFQNIFHHPEQYKSCFLPSMPHDDDYEVAQFFENNYRQFSEEKKLNSQAMKRYACKNGHIYYIGECTKPAQSSKCQCGEPIGGNNHNLVSDNQASVSLHEKLENGYCILTAANQTPQSIRNMGFLNTYLLRFFLDSTLYLSAKFDKSNIKKPSILDLLTTRDQNQIKNLDHLFLKNLQNDVKFLSKCLEHSPDEVLLFLHFIINQFNDKRCCSNTGLSTKQERNKYETEFCQFINQKVVQDLSADTLLKSLLNVLRDDAQNSDMDQLFRIAYDFVQVRENTERSADNHLDFLNQQQYWLFKKQITIDTMINAFKSSNEIQKRSTTLNLLNEFLDNLYQLKLIKHLLNISKMCDLMFEKFNKQIDKQNSCKITLKYLLNETDLETRQILELGAESFLKAFKHSSANLNLKNSIKLLEFVDANLLPISYLLPSNLVQNNDGIFIYTLVVYLIKIQNDFLTKNVTKENIEEKIELSNLNLDNLIAFSIQKDLMPIVFMNSNYSLEVRKESSLEFNFEKIQEAIRSKFLSNKSQIEVNVIIFLIFENYFY